MSLTPLLSVIIVSFVLGIILTPAAIRAGHRYGILDMPGQHKRHKRPTPILGGVALFFTVWITLALFWIVFPSTARELGGSVFFIFGGSLIILLVGFSDDLSPVSAWVKLLAQIASGLLLYMGGLKVELLSTPFGAIQIGDASVVITLLWVVVLTNAINLIDGLDGLAAGVSLIGAVTLLVIGQLYRVGTVLVLVLILVGFLSSFLWFNRHPAKIFLGDSGAMQLGFYFAVFSLMFPLKSYTLSALYIPLLALGVPLTETISSVVRRLATGRNVMRADRRHLFHYLALLGVSPGHVVLIFYALATVYGLIALAMFYWNRVVVFAVLVVFMVVIFALFFILVTKFLPGKMGGRRSDSNLRKS